MNQDVKEKVIAETIENNPNTRIVKLAKQILQRMPKKSGEIE